MYWSIYKRGAMRPSGSPSSVLPGAVGGVERRLVLHFVIAAITVRAERHIVEGRAIAALLFAFAAEHRAHRAPVVLHVHHGVLAIHGVVRVAPATPPAVGAHRRLRPIAVVEALGRAAAEAAGARPGALARRESQ